MRERGFLFQCEVGRLSKTEDFRPDNYYVFSVWRREVWSRQDDSSILYYGVNAENRWPGVQNPRSKLDTV